MIGFRDSFARDLPGASLSRVLQLGAGGAGAAVASALLSLGAQRMEIADVQHDRAEALAERLRLRFKEADVVSAAVESLDTRGFSGVVNATPIGMAAHAGSPLASSQLRPDMWVVDVIYFPLETELLRQAQAVGCRVLNGSGMVIGQAALAFEIMTARVASQQRMARSFHQMPAVPADS
jgi:shikimate dehydrogenase